MSVLIYSVIKSSANGVSISSATGAEEKQWDLWEWHLRVKKQKKMKEKKERKKGKTQTEF